MPQRDALTEQQPGRIQGTFPTFLVIGAPHSGAPALARLLRRFPTVHLPPEESTFFERNFDRGARWYQERFQPTSETKVIGDVAPDVLAAGVDHCIVAARIDGFLPDVRLVAVLRDPVERGSARLEALIRRGDLPPHESLEEVVEHGDPHDLISSGLYGEHLLPFLETFGERLLLVDHHELIARPSVVAVEVARHVGAPITVDPHPSDDIAMRGEDSDAPEKTTQVLEPHFTEDLHLLHRLTGFRFGGTDGSTRAARNDEALST